MTAPVSRFVEVDGLRLHVLDWNADATATVVLIHGINVQAHTWDPIALELSSARRVLAVDLRGHGESDWASTGYAIDSFVADLVGVLDALAVDVADVVGHSLGGRIAIAFAGRVPHRVRTLTLSDTGPEVARGGGEYSRRIVATTQEVRGFRDRAEVRAHYARLHPEWRPEFLDLHAAHQVRENWAGKLVFRSDPDLFWLTGSAGSRENPALWADCKRVTAPVLVMWGTRSLFLDEELAARMLQAFPQVELCRIEAGHYIPREVPQDFTATLLEFLERPAATATTPRGKP